MRTKTKTLTAIAVAAVLGGAALAGASYAGHRDGGFGGRHGHGLGFLDKGQLAVSAMEMFDAIDADGDGKLTQAEIDRLRNDRHGTHDADGDGSFEPRGSSPGSGTRPCARSRCACFRCSIPTATRSSAAPSTTVRSPKSSSGWIATATVASR